MFAGLNNRYYTSDPPSEHSPGGGSADPAEAESLREWTAMLKRELDLTGRLAWLREKSDSLIRFISSANLSESVAPKLLLLEIGEIFEGLALAPPTKRGVLNSPFRDPGQKDLSDAEKDEWYELGLKIKLAMNALLHRSLLHKPELIDVYLSVVGRFAEEPAAQLARKITLFFAGAPTTEKFHRTLCRSITKVIDDPCLPHINHKQMVAALFENAAEAVTSAIHSRQHSDETPLIEAISLINSARTISVDDKIAAVDHLIKIFPATPFDGDESDAAYLHYFSLIANIASLAQQHPEETECGASALRWIAFAIEGLTAADNPLARSFLWGTIFNDIVDNQRMPPGWEDSLLSLSDERLGPALKILDTFPQPSQPAPVVVSGLERLRDRTESTPIRNTIELLIEKFGGQTL